MAAGNRTSNSGPGRVPTLKSHMTSALWGVHRRLFTADFLTLEQGSGGGTNEVKSSSSLSQAPPSHACRLLHLPHKLRLPQERRSKRPFKALLKCIFQALFLKDVIFLLNTTPNAPPEQPAAAAISSTSRDSDVCSTSANRSLHQCFCPGRSSSFISTERNHLTDAHHCCSYADQRNIRL